MTINKLLKAKKTDQFAFVLSGIASALLATYFQTKYLYFYDYSYLADITRRLQIGQVPYVDFDLVLTPGTFYLHYWFSSLFGISSLSSQIFVVLASTCTTLTYIRIVTFLLRNNKSIFLKKTPFLLFPLLGPTYMVSFPLYDVLSTWMVGLSIYLTIRVFTNPNPRSSSLLFVGFTGIAPFVFKQNVGIIYFLTYLVMIAFGGIRKIFPMRAISFIYIGNALSLTLLYSILQFTGVSEPFKYQVFTYAQEAKSVSILSELLRYKDRYLALIILLMTFSLIFRRLRKYAVTLPLIFGGAVSTGTLVLICFNKIGIGEFPINRPLINWLIILPVCILIVLICLKDAQQPRVTEYVIAFLIFGALFGSYLSQGYKGSSYSWGCAYLMVTYVAISISANISRSYTKILLALTLCTSLWYLAYSGAGERYADQTFTSQKFELDMSDRIDGFLPMQSEARQQIRELKNFFERNPGTIVELPMEDPLFLINQNYEPQGRCSQLIWITCTNSKSEADQLMNESPDYFVLKNQLQLPWNPEPDADFTITKIRNCFLPVFRNDNYQVYRPIKNDVCINSGN